MATKILSFLKDGQHWRVMKVPHGYYHRCVSNPPEWLSGIPVTLSQKEIDDAFQQLSPNASLLKMNDLQYQSTIHIGATNTVCIKFMTTSDDVFTITIPSDSVHALQAAAKMKKIPELRIARIALEYLVDQGLPEIVVESGSAVLDLVKARLIESH